MTTIPAPGFTDPTPDAQRVFRALLDALARPGRRVPVSGIATAPPELGPTLAAVALTLLDGDTPVFFTEPFATPLVRSYLTFHTETPETADLGEALFVLARPASLPPWQSLRAGTDESPHDAATVLLDARSEFRPHPAGSVAWQATGPGIEDVVDFDASWAPAEFRAQRARMLEQFPRGVDLLVAGEDDVLGLPRTTRLDTPHGQEA